MKLLLQVMQVKGGTRVFELIFLSVVNGSLDTFQLILKLFFDDVDSVFPKAKHGSQDFPREHATSGFLALS